MSKRAVFRYVGLAIVLATTVLHISGVEAARTCSREEAILAEEDTDTLVDWDAVYRSFKRYGHCDDGSIGEGYSDGIGRLLSKDWGHFGRLLQLTKKNKSFERFVIRHIDETVPSDSLHEIVENARTSCPQNAKRLCLLIEEAAK